MMAASTRRVRVLIADGGDHYKILEQIHHLLDGKCDTTFFLIDNDRYDYEQLFPSARRAKVIRCGLRGIPFFARLLMLGRRYDFINVSTGPDGSHFTELFRIACFYLCCLLYRRKIIFTVRNTYPYLASTSGLFSYIRSRSIRHLHRFTFETATMRDAFIAATGMRHALLGVSYDRYSDVGVAAQPRPAPAPDAAIRIGLLGSVSAERRDYDSIVDALERLGTAERAGLTFVTLGMCAGGADHPIIRRLAALVTVDCRSGLLSEQEFAERGDSCHVLFSPLTRKKAYGTLHGSGTFGDAVALRKRVILPRFADPHEEFGPLCLYYGSTEQLGEVFRHLRFRLDTPVEQKVFERFRTDHVFAALIEDLRLRDVCAAGQGGNSARSASRT